MYNGVIPRNKHKDINKAAKHVLLLNQDVYTPIALDY